MLEELVEVLFEKWNHNMLVDMVTFPRPSKKLVGLRWGALLVTDRSPAMSTKKCKTNEKLNLFNNKYCSHTHSHSHTTGFVRGALVTSSILPHDWAAHAGLVSVGAMSCLRQWGP